MVLRCLMVAAFLTGILLNFKAEITAQDPAIIEPATIAAAESALDPVLTATPTASERGPRELIEEMLARLKATHEPVVILDYIHWPSAYAAYPESETKMKQIDTPQQLESYMRAVLSDPQKYLRDQLAQRMSKLPEDMAAKLRASTDRVVESMAMLKERMAQRISDTQYRIGKVTMLGGDHAEIELIAVLDEDERSSIVKLVKIENRWYLPTVEYAKSEGGQL